MRTDREHLQSGECVPAHMLCTINAAECLYYAPQRQYTGVGVAVVVVSLTVKVSSPERGARGRSRPLFRIA